MGHTQNYAGHSESSVQGYTVPLFVWQHQGDTLKQATLVDLNETYSTQYLDHLIQGALGIQSVWYQAVLDPLHAYRMKNKP